MSLEWMAVGMVIVAILFAYLAIKLKNSFAYLQFLFMVLCIYTLVAAFAMMSALALSVGQVAMARMLDSMMWVNILVGMFVTFFYIMFYIKNILEFMAKLRRRPNV
jgi:hypothetical protein